MTFEATPWARGILLRDPEGLGGFVDRAHRAGASVRIGGRSNRGPWLVRLSRRERVLEFRGSALPETLTFALDRWEAGASDAGMTWVAAAEGIAHAQEPRRARTACGLPQTDIRYRHPEVSRCRGCWIALDAVPVAA